MANRSKPACRALLLCLSLCAAAQAAEVPEALKPPAGQTLAFTWQASGVQIYLCQAKKDDPSAAEWVFQAPEAQLGDASGKPAGKHYAGPTWEALDGSKIVGEVKAKEAGRSPGSIPWLLLAVKSEAGKGVLSGIKSIQRLDTVGGAAPQTASKEQVGQTARVPYTASYAFYR
jgi:Protein of unknown function (DUF3455)